MSYECLYVWKATFKDGTTLQQFDSNKNETSFREVRIRLEDLTQFELSGGIHKILLDLASGFFNVDGIILVPSYKENMVLTEQVPKRLIYFRTVSAHLGQSSTSSGVEVDYCIGWQATVEGKNITHILRINPSEIILFE